MSEMRLQRFLARAGVASRRASEQLITQGRISVNGEVADKLGTKIDMQTDVVCLDGSRVSIVQTEAYIMLNKPLNCLTTMSDPQGRRCVADILPVDEYPGLYPVGRLDRNTTGLLLFTTNGELGNALLHPSHHVLKTYVVCVEGTPTRHQLHMLRTGVKIESGRGRRVITHPAEVELLESGTQARILIGIREGINRQIRKMCTAVGHDVVSLHRCSFGSLSLGNLKEGEWRELSEREVDQLKDAAGFNNNEEVAD